ncbi:hypothetical protein JL721_11660 [Aureococcus anophagefferens]|nr:hypothetical protein JL721_11660 [Aureococcus anophagefferens]
MPGGVGTLDELWDAASLQQLGFKTSRPVVLVNLDGYYDATFAQLQRAHDEGLTSKPPAEILHAVPDVGAALAWCEAQQTADAYTAGIRCARAAALPCFAAGLACGAASRRSCSGAGPRDASFAFRARRAAVCASLRASATALERGRPTRGANRKQTRPGTCGVFTARGSA